jgi:hypothetical protein
MKPCTSSCLPRVGGVIPAWCARRLARPRQNPGGLGQAREAARARPDNRSDIRNANTPKEGA